jgi:hypothetical protein
LRHAQQSFNLAGGSSLEIEILGGKIIAIEDRSRRRRKISEVDGFIDRMR